MQSNSIPASTPIGNTSTRRTLHSRAHAWRYQTFEFERKPMTWQARARDWHKRAGLFAAIFMIWLGSSGFLLNQSASWGLDAVRIDTAWLMSLYGLHPEPPNTGFQSGDHWLAQTSENTLLNGRPMLDMIPSPLGVVASGGENPLIFIAASDRLVIANAQAQRIDELRGYTLPVSAIRRIGASLEGDIVIQDLDSFMTRDGLSWEPVPLGTQVNWSTPERLTHAQQQAALAYSKPTMPLEQILIDAHSGRLFGRYGPWVTNLVGIAAILLGLNGVFIYWSTARRRRRRRG